MALSTNKKVLIVRFDREALRGFVNPGRMAGPEGVEVLSINGTVTVVPYREARLVCFVKDWEGRTPLEEKRSFLTRPKAKGLWLRLTFRDGEEIEALGPNNLLQWEPLGITVTPPDPASNTQKMFVPREALEQAQVLGVVGSPRKEAPKRKPKQEPAEERTQIRLFDS